LFITGSQVPADIHIEPVVLRGSQASPVVSAQSTTVHTAVKLNVTIDNINMQLFNGDSDLVSNVFSHAILTEIFLVMGSLAVTKSEAWKWDIDLVMTRVVSLFQPQLVFHVAFLLLHKLSPSYIAQVLRWTLATYAVSCAFA
jgi:hypothetical protein